MVPILIQSIAVGLQENGKTLTFSELRTLLAAVGYNYETDLGVARGAIRSAYARTQDPNVKRAVATAFTNRYGEYPWQKEH